MDDALAATLRSLKAQQARDRLGKPTQRAVVSVEEPIWW
jgi:hypothetical protein